MKRKHSSDLANPTFKKQAVSSDLSLVFTLPEVMVNIIEQGQFSLEELRQLKIVCNGLYNNHAVKLCETQRKNYIQDIRLTSQVAVGAKHLFFNQQNKQLLWMSHILSAQQAGQYPNACTLATKFLQFNLPDFLKDKTGHVKNIFPGTVFTFLECEKGIFGIKAEKPEQLFQIHTKSIEQQYGSIIHFYFNEESGFLMCEKGLLGFGSNSFGQLGLGSEDAHAFGKKFDTLEELFANIRAIDDNIFLAMKQAGTMLKIVNKYGNSMIIFERAIFCCGENHFSHMGFMDSNMYQFKDIDFNPAEAGQFIQASIGERHTLMLFKNHQGQYDLYGCGENDQRQLGREDRADHELGQFAKIDFPRHKGNPLMIVAHCLNSFILCERGLFIAGLDSPIWELDVPSDSSDTSVDEEEDPWGHNTLHPWVSADTLYTRLKEQGEILQIIEDIGVLCEKGIFLTNNGHTILLKFLSNEIFKSNHIFDYIESDDTISLAPNL